MNSSCSAQNRLWHHQGGHSRRGSAVFLLLIITLLGLTACSATDDLKPLAFVVKQTTFEHKIIGQGYLEPIKSVKITLPPGTMSVYTIKWIRPSYSRVKKGDLLVEFDGQAMISQRRQEQVEMAKLGFTRTENEQDLSSEEHSLHSEKKRIEWELKIARHYDDDAGDLAFSRNELIDASQNLNYVKAERHYNQWGLKSHQGKANSERDLLHAKEASHRARLTQSEARLAKMRVRAPRAGIFLKQNNWYGEPPKSGTTVWPGMVIGKLPDLDKLQARIQVYEGDANGLKQGLVAHLRVDALPGKILSGKVVEISTRANSRQRGVPTKYFAVKIKLNRGQRRGLKPGYHVTVAIEVDRRKRVLSVPLPAVFRDGHSRFVYRLEDGAWHMVPVELETQSASHAIIRSGIVAGDTIALSRPERVQ